MLLDDLRGGDAVGEGDCLVAQALFGVEEDDLVDEVLGEEGAVQVGAAFEQEADAVAVGEKAKGGGEAEAAGVLRKDLDLGAVPFEGGDARLLGLGTAEDEEIVMGGVEEFGVEGGTEVGVEDDAEEGAAAGEAAGGEEVAAVREGGVVGEDGADAGEDGVGGVAEELDLVAGGLAGEPVGLIGEAVRGCGGELAIGGEGGLEGDKGAAGADEVREGVVELSGLRLADAEHDFDADGAELCEASTADCGVGVFGGDDSAGDAGGDEGVGTGAGAAVVGAGLESDVGGGAAGIEATVGGELEGDDLGVVAMLVEVSTLGEDLVVADEEAADRRVGAGEGGGSGGEREGPLHEVLVLLACPRR